MALKIPIEISAKHIHLSSKDLEIIFGKGYKLTPIRQLSQPGQFACQETVIVKLGDREISNIRVIGPERKKTQVEFSLSDIIHLGLKPNKIELDKKVPGSEKSFLAGSKGGLNLKYGIVVPQRHLHLSKSQARILKIKNGADVVVKIKGKRQVVFFNIKSRVGKNHTLCLHLDSDEGNGAGIMKRGEGILVR